MRSLLRCSLPRHHTSSNNDFTQKGTRQGALPAYSHSTVLQATASHARDPLHWRTEQRQRRGRVRRGTRRVSDPESILRGWGALPAGLQGGGERAGAGARAQSEMSEEQAQSGQ